MLNYRAFWCVDESLLFTRGSPGNTTNDFLSSFSICPTPNLFLTPRHTHFDRVNQFLIFFYECKYAALDILHLKLCAIYNSVNVVQKWNSEVHCVKNSNPTDFGDFFCFTAFLEPASYITQNSSSKLFIPLSATFIWTCWSNLLHTAITFHHFFTVSLWAQDSENLILHLSLFLSVGLISWL